MNARKTTTARSATASPLVTLKQIKDHLAIYDDQEDQLLMQFAVTATEQASSFCNVFFSDTDIVDYFEDFDDMFLYLSQSYLLGDTVSVEFVDENGDTRTVLPSKYIIDNTAGYIRIVRKMTEDSWTDLRLSGEIENPVKISYKTGIVPVLLDNRVNNAILMYITELYENRSNLSEKLMNRLPLSSERLLTGFVNYMSFI